MISMDVKTEPKTITSKSSIVLPENEKESTLSFSELLKGVNNSKDDKIIQNGALLLSLEADEKTTKSTKTSTKNDALLNLLKNDDNHVVKSEEPLALNPKLSADLSVKEMKVLVSDAKEYLKSKITQSDDYKMSQIKELPKTLKGLVDVAKKIGIDISKISVEEVRGSDALKKSEIKLENINNLKEIPKLNTQVSEKTNTKDVAVKTIVDALNMKENLKSKSTIETKIAPEPVDVKTENKSADKVKNEIKTPLASDVKIEPAKEIPKEIKSTPLFKAQTKVELTTEQIVQTKANSHEKVEVATPKQRADETLKLLLRGEKPQVNVSASKTADFSVETARVIAPTTQTQVSHSLEKLLRGENSESKTENVSSSKTDGLTAPKADSFEVKINEAKQMVKYLSSDVKTAIEDYKSPFTRVKVQLNPQKLGEVDLTVVQRGNNLHVSLSSNNAAINTLAMNVNELRTQLNNNGINNATFNFNSNSDSNNSNGSQQQQNRQNEQKAHEEYNYLESQEHDEEILSSLEIVVPRYI